MRGSCRKQTWAKGVGENALEFWEDKVTVDSSSDPLSPKNEC